MVRVVINDRVSVRETIMVNTNPLPKPAKSGTWRKLKTAAARNKRRKKTYAVRTMQADGDVIG